MLLNYIALGGIVFLIVAIAAIVVVLGSLPGKIARRRGHPQVDAVNAASWISFLGFGLLWPLAFVWAFVRPSSSASHELEQLNARLSALEDDASAQPDLFAGTGAQHAAAIDQLSDEIAKRFGRSLVHRAGVLRR